MTMREGATMPKNLDRVAGPSPSSLLPMLIGGLMLIAIGMIAVAAFS